MVRFMNHPKTARVTDLERLGRLEIFSWLTASELRLLSALLAKSNYVRGDVIFSGLAGANEARVLIAGIARVTCLNADNQRVTVALVPPGPIPELPSLLMSRFDFRCEAYNDCRVGTLEWNGFDRITVKGAENTFRKFHQNDLKHWYRLLRHTSGLLNDLHERVAVAMLDLCDDFGIQDSRGTLLTLSISQKDIASIVGASRPRITEHLAQLERNHLLRRQGRQFIVNVAKLSGSLGRTAAKRLPVPWSKASDAMGDAAASGVC